MPALFQRGPHLKACTAHTHTRVHKCSVKYQHSLAGFHNLKLLQSNFSGTAVFITDASGVQENNKVGSWHFNTSYFYMYK